MLKPNLHQPVLEYPAGFDTDLESGRRLLVLLPADMDYHSATRRIWQLASSVGSNVLLLGLCTDPVEEAGLRRELITMASLLQDGRITVEINVEIGTNWLNTVKTLTRADDTIVCFAEQRAGLLRRPLGQILDANLNTSVYILSGLIPRKSKPHMLLQVSAWLGFIGMIAGFGLLQVSIVQYSEGWLQNILLILSTLSELGLIWAWNGLFS